MRFLIPSLLLTTAVLTGCNPHSPTTQDFLEFNQAAEIYILNAVELSDYNDSKCGPIKDIPVPTMAARIKEVREMLPENGKKHFNVHLQTDSFVRSLNKTKASSKSYASGPESCKSNFARLTTGKRLEIWLEAKKKMDRMTGW